jgi:hypothetical protein
MVREIATLHVDVNILFGGRYDLPFPDEILTYTTLNIDGRTAVEVACLEEEWDTVHDLIEVGADVGVVFQGISMPQSIDNKGVAHVRLT